MRCPAAPPPAPTQMHSMAASKDELVPKKGTVSSVVWNWFGFVASDSEQTTTYCKVCCKAVATKGSSMTNLFQHLKQRHAAEWEKCCSLRDSQESCPQTPAKKQSTIADSFSHCVPYDKKMRRWKTLTDAVALHMAKDMVTIYTVEKTGFIHVKNFRPQVCATKPQVFCRSRLASPVQLHTGKDRWRAAGGVVLLHHNRLMVQPNHAALHEFDCTFY